MIEKSWNYHTVCSDIPPSPNVKVVWPQCNAGTGVQRGDLIYLTPYVLTSLCVHSRTRKEDEGNFAKVKWRILPDLSNFLTCTSSAVYSTRAKKWCRKTIFSIFSTSIYLCHFHHHFLLQKSLLNFAHYRTTCSYVIFWILHSRIL